MYISISIIILCLFFLFLDNCTFASYESEGVCVQSCPEGLIADVDLRVCRNTTGECTCMHVCAFFFYKTYAGIIVILLQ